MIRDPETGWTEPAIRINGTALTFAQAMTIRVAVGSFLMTVNDQGARQELGIGLADGYRARLLEVEALMRGGDR